MEKYTVNDIIAFIKSRFSKNCHWLDGNCYYFAVILKDRFNGKIYYDTENAHFITKINDKFYDWTGRVNPKLENLLDWDILEKQNPSYYKKIQFECVY